MSIYIHIPFCKRKCFYCSFSIFIGKEKNICTYLDCLEKEAAKYRGQKVDTVYIGGGTPSSLSIDQIKSLFKIIKNNFQVSENSEITFEVNPEDINKEKLSLLKEKDVNRLSIGVQTLNDKYLNRIGRGHDRDLVCKAIALVKKEKFKNINLDLMYGFDGQSNSELNKDIKEICAFDPEHLSLYTLTVEQNSKFYTAKVQQKTDDALAEQFLIVRSVVQGYGYKQYEISNFAKKGRESLHNINYWQAGNYVGLGMGAHSHFDGKRIWNVDSFVKYIKMMQKDGSAIGGEERLSRKERLVEALIFGLRMNAGVNIEMLESRFCCKLDNKRWSVLNALVDGKMILMRKGHLQATQKGQLLLDEISCRLI